MRMLLHDHAEGRGGPIRENRSEPRRPGADGRFGFREKTGAAAVEGALPWRSCWSYLPGSTSGDLAMGDVINLRLHRKRRERAQREGQAAENRVRSGRTKAAKEQERAVVKLEAERLEQHRLSDDSDTTRKK
jgi:hypothetical protein